MRETTVLKEFTRNGWMLPAAATLTPGQVQSLIQKTMERLAGMHAYVEFTDHLSDTELYEELDEIIKEYPLTIWPDDVGAAVSISLIEGDTEAWLKYYASEKERTWYKKFYRTEQLPESCLPP